MNKKICIIEAAFLIFLFSVFTITVQANPSIIVADYELSPSVFSPGDSGTLKLTIKNAESINTVTSTSTTGSQTTVKTETVGAIINNIWIKSAYYNNKKVSAITNYEDIGELAPGASIEISFKIIVDDGIGAGSYYPIVCIDVEDFEDIRYPIEIIVSNSSVDLIPIDLPSKLSKIGATDISFSIINNHESTINNIRIKPNSIDGIVIKPETAVLDSLNAGSSQIVQFSLIPIHTGVNNLTFNMIYKNGENEHSSISFVGVEVVDTLDVAPIIYKLPSKIKEGEKKSIQLKIYNSKNEDISSVIVTPISNVKLTPSQYFIGEMDANDVYSVSFDIDATDLTINQTYDIGFTVTFKQAGTTFETPVIESSFTVVSNNGNGEEAAISIVVFLIILSVGGFLIYRWRKKGQIKKISLK